MMYDLLASVYDEINGDISYPEWADFIERIIKDNYTAGKPELVLDLGCGTGSMTIELARRGYDMTGIDLSPEMLDVARARAEEAGVGDKMLWLCQDMTEFELYGTVDVAVSCLDCLNHLTEDGELKKCLSLVHNYLIPDGLFIFDINGRAKFENIYASNSYVMETEGAMCVWQNDYDPEEELCGFYITLFSERDDGTYERYDEEQCERMYTLDTVKRLLGEEGFELIGAYSDYSLTPATDESERIYVAARCIKE